MNEEKQQELDYFGPAFIMSGIMAGLADLGYIFMIGAIIPIVGIIIAVMSLAIHYIAGLAILATLYPKIRHFVPRLVLLTAVILPLPLLTLGIVLAVVMQNRFIEAAVTQTAALAATLITSETGGWGGAVVEAGAAGGGAAGGAATVAEGVEAAGAVARGAATAAEGTQTASRGSKVADFAKEKAKRAGRRALEGVVGEGPEETGEKGDYVPDEALGEEPDVNEKLKRGLFPQNLDEVIVDDSKNEVDLAA